MNISHHFYARPVTVAERFVAKGLIEREETPEAILFFTEHCHKLGHHAYWLFLSTCWVSYTGWSDLSLWRDLFSSQRPLRKESVMKPDEVRLYDALPYHVTAYRAHRPGETDWLSYTLDIQIAKRFARERKVSEISEYRLKRSDILALFTRRNEQEILVLDSTKAVFQRTHSIHEVCEVTR